MSNEQYPIALPGLTFNVVRQPKFITKVQTSASGREQRLMMSTSPLWTITLNYEFLRSDAYFSELQTLAGFFLNRYGSWDSFLFQDPDDCNAVGSQFGIGDGVTVAWQLFRVYGGYAEPTYNVDVISLSPPMWATDLDTPMWPRTTYPLMWYAHVSIPYTVSTTGVITFESPPPVGAQLFWTGTYYYRCRFVDDGLEIEKFMLGLWQAQKVQFVGSLGGKI